jgi:hypothetical protein
MSEESNGREKRVAHSDGILAGKTMPMNEEMDERFFNCNVPEVVTSGLPMGRTPDTLMPPLVREFCHGRQRRGETLD